MSKALGEQVNSKMTVDSELIGLSIPQKFMAYAVAYLDAATTLNANILNGASPNNWSNSSVILHLATHAVELFLKSAIYSVDPKANIVHHNLERLYAEFLKQYAGEEYAFEMPFIAESIELTEDEIQSLRTPTQSVRYRYPTRNGVANWDGVHGFKADFFEFTLQQLATDFSVFRAKFT